MTTPVFHEGRVSGAVGWLVRRKYAVFWPAAALLASLPAFAQGQDGTNADQPVIEEVVVVGSLIRRSVVYEGAGAGADAGLRSVRLGRRRATGGYPQQPDGQHGFLSRHAAELPAGRFAIQPARRGAVFHPDADQWTQGGDRAGLQRRGAELLRHQLAPRAADRAGRDPARRRLGHLRFPGGGGRGQHRHPPGLFGARDRRRVSDGPQQGIRPRFRHGRRDAQGARQLLRRPAQAGREFSHRVRLDDPPGHRPGRGRRHRGRLLPIRGAVRPAASAAPRPLRTGPMSRIRSAASTRPGSRTRTAGRAGVIRAVRCAGWIFPTSGR